MRSRRLAERVGLHGGDATTINNGEHPHKWDTAVWLLSQTLLNPSGLAAQPRRVGTVAIRPERKPRDIHSRIGYGLVHTVSPRARQPLDVLDALQVIQFMLEQGGERSSRVKTGEMSLGEMAMVVPTVAN